jgi:hypothetical protein
MRHLLMVATLLAGACYRPTGVRVRIELENGAPAPETLRLSAYDVYGAVAESKDLDARKLPGDVLLLVRGDAGAVRLLADGAVGELRLTATKTVAVASGREAKVTLVLSTALPPDRDGDQVPDIIDNCPDEPNGLQEDTDGSGRGDACPLAPPVNGPDDMAVGPSLDGDVPPGKPDFSGLPPDDLAVIKPAACGDGIVQAGELCDEGAANSDAPAVAGGCTSLCRLRAPCGLLVGSRGAQIDPQTGHCYIAWGTQLNWANASFACQSAGGHLVTISSVTENDRVMTLAGNNTVWIGLTQDHGQAVRDRWVTGEAVTFTAYATNEPNNGGNSPPSERCGVVSLTRGGWDDRPCGMESTGYLPESSSAQNQYICENQCGNGVVETGEGCDPPGPTCTTTCQVKRACTEAGAVSSPLNGHCYFRSGNAVNFATALTACPAGTHLATLNEVAESIAANTATGMVETWFALREASPTIFRWQVGTEIFEPSRFHGFEGQEPNDATTPACARLVPNEGWKDQPCGNTYVPMCERE